MGTGWRRAFCTTIPRDSDSNSISDKQNGRSPSPSPRSCVRLGFLSGGGSNPSTPRLPSSSQPISSSSLRCKTTTEESLQKTPKSVKTQKPLVGSISNPSSPRSPLKLSLFKNSFKFRSSCGICLNSVKTGQGTAIYTAECGHAFHFPCVAAHVKNHNTLVCPVCSVAWKDVPLLALHKNNTTDVVLPDYSNSSKPKIEDKNMIEYSPRALKSKPHQVSLQLQKQSKPLFESRSYDDDEPLLSPTADGRIIPIPEADEDDNDDDAEEFQGFFVNPNPSPSIKSYGEPEIDARDTRNNVEVRLLPESAVISASQSHQTYAVVLKVKAPPPPSLPSRSSSSAPLLHPSHRAPIDLVTVLDVSGSMTGAKLHMLKRAMRLVISSLSSADRLSIVTFSATPKRLLPLKRMTNQGQRTARHIIDRLVCGQGTSVGEALRKARKVLEDRRDRNPVASIMLLSDGQDERVNKAGTNQRQVMRNDSSTRFSHIEIPVHAFGFGETGGYNHEPAEDAFAKCVGGLLSVVIQDLRVQLGFPSSGSHPVEITAAYSCNGRPTVCGSGSIRVGDLYAEEEREFLVELKVPTTTAVGAHHVMSVQCLYKDPSTQGIVHGKQQGLLLPRLQSVRSSAPSIERLRNLFITTRAIAESRILIQINDSTSAHHLLSSARALLLQSSSSSSVEEYIRGLEVELEQLHWRRQNQHNQQQRRQQTIVIQRRRGNEREVASMVDENGEPLTPTSAWRAAEMLAKVAIMKKSLTSRVSDLHGFENARF